MANVENTGSDTNNPNPEVTEVTEKVERKSWNFGNFGTRHDGEVWSLVRIKNKVGEKLPADEQDVISSNKSATPLVALARLMNLEEKRDVKISKLQQKLTLYTAELNELTVERDAQVEAAAAAALEAEVAAEAAVEAEEAAAAQIARLEEDVA